MVDEPLFSLALIVVLGILAQWLGARLRLPAILLLLGFGFLAGPATGWVRPDALFGEILFPFVSLCVGLILYEGGLSLRLSELQGGGRVVRNLCTIGVVVTAVLAAAGAHFIFGMERGLALLVGVIFVVTGPTVVGPLLRHVRPRGEVGPILNWEGIVVDPIGAILAVLVFEALTVGGQGHAAWELAGSLVRTLVCGGAFGLIAAGLLTFMLARYWIPDPLQNAVSLMFVVAAFSAANLFQHESGLLAATVMGIALANQRQADIRHIVEFKENLRVLLISVLFIVLAARLNPADMRRVGWYGGAFVGLLVLVARPAAVWLSTLGSGLSRRERLFLAWVAPRGIVAAAVASIFQLRLQQEGYPGANLLEPLTFATITGTVAIYGLTVPWVAWRLGVAERDPQGLLLVGAHGWARQLAAVVRDKGFSVLLVDSNHANVTAARMAGLPVYADSILAEYALREMRLGGLGRLLAVTSNDWVNTLAVQRFVRLFGQAACYQLPPQDEPEGRQERHRHLHGRWLFGEVYTYSDLARRSASGFVVKATHLTETFDYEAFRRMYGESAVPMLVITEAGKLEVLTADRTREPQPGQTLVALVDPSRDGSSSG